MCHPNSLKDLSPIRLYQKIDCFGHCRSQWSTGRPGLSSSTTLSHDEM